MRRCSKSEKEVCCIKGTSQNGQSIAMGYSLFFFESGAEQSGFSQIKVKLKGDCFGLVRITSITSDLFPHYADSSQVLSNLICRKIGKFFTIKIYSKFTHWRFFFFVYTSFRGIGSRSRYTRVCHSRWGE